MLDNLGEIILFAGDSPIRNFTPCHGQILAISTNNALYQILGNTYGGDGTTTFGLPDLRGKVLVGTDPDNDAFKMGAKAGDNTYELNQDNMPPIPFMVSSASATQSVATAGCSIASPGNNVNGAFAPTSGYNTATPNITIGAGGGDGEKVNNMQPYVQMQYMICTTGTRIE